MNIKQEKDFRKDMKRIAKKYKTNLVYATLIHDKKNYTKVKLISGIVTKNIYGLIDCFEAATRNCQFLREQLRKITLGGPR